MDKADKEFIEYYKKEYPNNYSCIVKQAKQEEREIIRNIMHREQFKGSRDYDEGCIKGYEKVMEYLKNILEEN